MRFTPQIPHDVSTGSSPSTGLLTTAFSRTQPQTPSRNTSSEALVAALVRVRFTPQIPHDVSTGSSPSTGLLTTAFSRTQPQTPPRNTASNALAAAFVRMRFTPQTSHDVSTGSSPSIGHRTLRVLTNAATNSLPQHLIRGTRSCIRENAVHAPNGPRRRHPSSPSIGHRTTSRSQARSLTV